MVVYRRGYIISREMYQRIQIVTYLFDLVCLCLKVSMFLCSPNESKKGANHIIISFHKFGVEYDCR